MDNSVEVTTNKDRKMTASVGHVLTNGYAYAEVIDLGKFDSPENWHEITDAEHAKIVAEKERQAEEEM
jgi:hypothetical protein